MRLHQPGRTLLGLSAALLLSPPALAADEPPDAGAVAAPDGGPPAAAAPAPAPGEDLSRLLAEADAAYAHRDEPGKMDEARSRLAEAEKLAPDAYAVLWRVARVYFWLADDPGISNDEKSRLGKVGWDYGDRATQADPGRVEGWFFAAAGVGNYSLGIGVVKALFQGLEGKFKERLERAQKIEPGFLDGGIENAWGRFYYELPWPKYDAEASERHLLAAIRVNPGNVRARVYLAELYLKEDHPAEARRTLDRALADVPGTYDAPEERRALEMARAVQARMGK